MRRCVNGRMLMGEAEDDEAMGRIGEGGRWGEGGVTSLCNIDVKIALACSEMG